MSRADPLVFLLGAKSFTYDLNGNLATRTDACGTTTYTWDARNRLTGIVNGYKPDCTPFTASFTYDALNRRISKTVDSVTTQYVYDGWDMIQEIKNSVKTNYVRTLNIDEPLARTNSTATRYYLLDALGSVIGLTDENGVSKTTYVYDAFGNATTSGEASDNPFQFTSRENDGTGLYYYRARYYSPEKQRFIEEDPIGLMGGMNYYAYVQNNPIRFIDPLGLASLVTDMQAQTTTFDPRPEDPNGDPYTIETRNDVTRNSLPGAQDPFTTPDVAPIDNIRSRAYGPEGAYIDTGDARGRDIHGGGSGLSDPYAPRQGWRPTHGCTRGQNEDVQELSDRISDFRRRHPGVNIPYTRR